MAGYPGRDQPTAGRRAGFPAWCDKTGGGFFVITGLDHVVVLTSDIGAGAAHYQTLFARAPAWRNSGDGAERVLFTLDNMSLELMAPAGSDANADRIPQRAGGAGRGAREPVFPHWRHRQDAPKAGAADPEAGAGRRGRKPRRALRRQPVVEADPRRH